MTVVQCDKIITPDGIKQGFVKLEGGKILSVEENYAGVPDFDFSGKYLAAGFIDLHTHGAGGYSFIENTAEDVIEGCNYMLRFGTTTVLPTVTTAPFSVMRKGLENVAAAKESGRVKNRIYGAHLEGPYLSLKQVGAQSPENVTAPKAAEYRRLVEEFGKYIARWTYAPERDEGEEFCEYLIAHGILPSAGHTDATYAQMKGAVEKGCRLITHLYSATSTVTRNKGFRSLGVIETAFLRDEIYVEIIADGKHLPPDLINMIIKIKGDDKVALVTDSMEIAGTDIVEGDLCGVQFIVEDGVCKLKDRSAFAGSVATANLLIKTLVEDCGVEIERAVKMLTEVPAKILGTRDLGRIEKGCLADLVVFDKTFTVTDVFVGGKKEI